MQVSDFPAILKADFGRFLACFGRFPACFGRIGSIGRRPIRANMADMVDMARFWPNQPDSARIEADSARIEPHRRESDKKKKKKNPDAVRRAGNRVGRRVPRRAALDAGAAPLVPRPCFLAFLMPCSKSPCVPV